MFEGKSEPEDRGLLNAMSGRKEPPGCNSNSTSTQIKKIQSQRKNTPKKAVKKPSVRKQEAKNTTADNIVNARTVRTFKTIDKDDIREDWK